MGQPLRLLIVEDNASDADLIQRHLARGGFDLKEARRVETADGLAGALADAEWDLVVCDYHLPHLDAPTALRIVRESGRDVPFLIVSGTVGEDIAVDMMKSGVHDYLLKDNLARLVPAVQRELREAVERRERRQAEAALRANEERFRDLARLLDLARDAILVCDLDDRISYWNRGAERLYGWTTEEIQGQSICGRLVTDPELFAGAKRELLASGEWRGEMRHVTRSGTPVSVSSSWSLVRDENGQPRSVLVINTDVTQRKLLEAQLLQAQKMEAIGRLAGGVAHDFNNLLTVILGFTQLQLMRDDLDADARANLQHILQAAEGASGLTRQLLTFSRKQVMQPRDLDPLQLVRNLGRMLERVIGEPIALAIEGAPDSMAIRADPHMIEQVVLNLVLNARDAMPNGGRITLTVAPQAIDASRLADHPRGRVGEFVCLEVTDTGCGMPEEVLNRLFEPFFTTKEAGKGTGLGLATVYGIVEQHGGWLEVSSRVGAGSVFRVFLPAATAADRESPNDASGGQVRGGSEALLLVEDEQAVRLMAREFLTGLGYRVWEADGGRSAQEVWAAHGREIDLLVTDIVMPGGVNGIELAAAMRRGRPDLGVVYISGYADGGGNARNPKLVEGENFVSKPFSLGFLAATVRRALDRR